jgi:DNA recombination protein RmuC
LNLEFAILAAGVLVALAILAALLLRRAPGQELVLGQMEALAAGLDRQRERLTQQMLDQTRGLGEAMLRQGERLAAQEKALAEAIAAQNGRIEAALGTTAERLTRQLAEQALATAQSSSAIQERLAVIDGARANIEALGAQVSNLAGILGNKQQRGAFGEGQLEQIIRDRLPPEGFAFQHTLGNGRRADCMIHLPHPPGPIAVDSKFPLEAWIVLRDAADDAARLAGMRQFRGDVLRHVKDVAERYIVAGETAEGAIIFVPSESIYAELHHSAAEVITEAARRGVYIVSPTTLWAVLTSMRALMRDVGMRDEAGRIQKEVRAVLEDVNRLDARVAELRGHFEKASAAIAQVETSARKIKRSGEKIEMVEFDTPSALPPSPLPPA